MKSSQSFTLIELLVVIAIIGLLAAIVMISLNNARAKARDARRLQDLKQFQTALELCYDKRGSYAINGETTITTPCQREPFQDSDFSGSWRQICGEFMSLPPRDPKGYDYTIHTTNDFKHYVFLAQMETNAYAMTPAEVLSFVQARGITTWTPCANFNYVIGN